MARWRASAVGGPAPFSSCQAVPTTVKRRGAASPRRVSWRRSFDRQTLNHLHLVTMRPPA